MRRLLYISGIVMFALACGLLVMIYNQQSKQETATIARAPHISANLLTLAYQKNNQVARAQFDNKVIVVTGILTGEDEGLFGDGCIYMGAVICDVGGHFGSAGVAPQTTVIGKCKGIDAYGSIRLTDARVLSQ